MHVNPPDRPADPLPPQVDVYIFEPKGISMVQTTNTFGDQFAELIKVTSTKDKVRPKLSKVPIAARWTARAPKPCFWASYKCSWIVLELQSDLQKEPHVVLPEYRDGNR